MDISEHSAAVDAARKAYRAATTTEEVNAAYKRLFGAEAALEAANNRVKAEKKKSAHGSAAAGAAAPMFSREEVLAYARECKRQRPQITDAEMRAFLEAKFIYGVDSLAEMAARGFTMGSIVCTQEWLRGLSSILLRISRSSGPDVIMDIIDGVVIIVRADPADPARTNS